MSAVERFVCTCVQQDSIITGRYFNLKNCSHQLTSYVRHNEIMLQQKLWLSVFLQESIHQSVLLCSICLNTSPCGKPGAGTIMEKMTGSQQKVF